MKDEIITAVWQAKDELAQEFEYDLEKLAAALCRKEQEHHHQVVDLSPHLPSTKTVG